MHLTLTIGFVCNYTGFSALMEYIQEIMVYERWIMCHSGHLTYNTGM